MKRKGIYWLAGGAGLTGVLAVVLVLVFLTGESPGETPDVAVVAPAPAESGDKAAPADPSTVSTAPDSPTSATAPPASSSLNKKAPASALPASNVQTAPEGEPTRISGAMEAISIKDSVTLSVEEPEAETAIPVFGIASVAPEGAPPAEAANPSPGGEAGKAPSVASNPPRQPGGSTEGIAVRTRSVIEIRDPDGTLVSRQEFE